MKIKQLAAALALTAFASSAALAASLPDVPVPFKSGAGAINDGVIYVGLGTAGQDWYKLDTKSAQPQWQKIAAFPAPARDQAQAVALNGKIYVFGGCGKIDSDITSVSNEVFEYDPATDTWTKLLTRSPIGLTGHTVVTADGKNALVIGSVNKEIFDGYFSDVDYANKAGDKALLDKINADYNGKLVKDYFFNKAILQYDPQNNLWTTVGNLPYFGTAGSAVAVDPADHSVFVVNGEEGAFHGEIHSVVNVRKADVRDVVFDAALMHVRLVGNDQCGRDIRYGLAVLLVVVADGHHDLRGAYGAHTHTRKDLIREDGARLRVIFAVDAVADVVQIARDLCQADALFVLSERAQKFARPLAYDPRVPAGMFGKPERLDLLFAHFHDRFDLAILPERRHRHAHGSQLRYDKAA